MYGSRYLRILQVALQYEYVYSCKLQKCTSGSNACTVRVLPECKLLTYSLDYVVRKYNVVPSKVASYLGRLFFIIIKTMEVYLRKYGSTTTEVLSRKYFVQYVVLPEVPSKQGACSCSCTSGSTRIEYSTLYIIKVEVFAYHSKLYVYKLNAHTCF